MPTYREFDGLRNDGAPERFGPGDLIVADNVDIDARGQLARRAGRRRVADGDFHSLWAAGDLCLMVGGDTLLRVHPDFELESLTKGLTLGSTMSYCPVAGRVYWSNGHETGVIEAGRVRSWGLPVPITPQALGYSGGTLPAGTYQYALTYLRDDGQEGGAGLAGTVEVPAGGAIVLGTLTPPTDPGVAAQIVYLSEPNGTVLYEVAHVPPTQVSVTVRALSATAVPLESAQLGPAPAGQLVAHWRGVLYVAAGDVLYRSEPYGYERFDLRRYWRLPGPITLVAPIDDPDGGGLFVATDSETGWISGADPDTASYVQKSTAGALPGTLAYLPGSRLGDGKLGERPTPLWMSPVGLVAGAPGGTLVPLTEGRYRGAFSGHGVALYQAVPSRYVAILNR